MGFRLTLLGMCDPGFGIASFEVIMHQCCLVTGLRFPFWLKRSGFLRFCLSKRFVLDLGLKPSCFVFRFILFSF